MEKMKRKGKCEFLLLKFTLDLLEFRRKGENMSSLCPNGVERRKKKKKKGKRGEGEENKRRTKGWEGEGGYG